MNCTDLLRIQWCCVPINNRITELELYKKPCPATGHGFLVLLFLSKRSVVDGQKCTARQHKMV